MVKSNKEKVKGQDTEKEDAEKINGFISLREMDQNLKESNLRSNYMGCPVILQLISSMNDALAFHDWESVLGLLPLLAYRAYPAVSNKYIYQVVSVLVNSGVLGSGKVRKIMKTYAPDCFLQLLTKEIQHLDEVFAEPSEDSSCEVDPLHKGKQYMVVLESMAEIMKISSNERYNITHDDIVFQSYQGLVLYIQYLHKREIRTLNLLQNQSITNEEATAGESLLEEMTPEDDVDNLLSEAVTVLQNVMNKSKLPCDWIVSMTLEAITEKHDEDTARDSLLQYLCKHPTHAPAFAQAFSYLEQRETDTNCCVVILKHLHTLSPSAVETLTLVENLIKTPQFITVTKYVDPFKDTEISLEALGSSDLFKDCLYPVNDRYSALLEEEKTKLGNVTKKCAAKNDPLYHYVHAQCTKIMMQFLSSCRWKRNKRGWEKLSDILSALYTTWIRCWECEHCLQSRCWVMSLLSVRWIDIFKNMDLPREKSVPLKLNKSTVAYILGAKSTVKYWKKCVTEGDAQHQQAAKVFLSKLQRDTPSGKTFSLFAKRAIKSTKKSPSSNLHHDFSLQNEVKVLRKVTTEVVREDKLADRFCDKDNEQSYLATPAKVTRFGLPNAVPFNSHPTQGTFVPPQFIVNRESKKPIEVDNISCGSPLLLASISPLMSPAHSVSERGVDKKSKGLKRKVIDKTVGVSTKVSGKKNNKFFKSGKNSEAKQKDLRPSKEMDPSTPKQSIPSTPKQSIPSTSKEMDPSTPKQSIPSTSKEKDPSTPKEQVSKDDSHDTLPSLPDSDEIFDLSSIRPTNDNSLIEEDNDDGMAVDTNVGDEIEDSATGQVHKNENMKSVVNGFVGSENTDVEPPKKKSDANLASTRINDGENTHGDPTVLSLIDNISAIKTAVKPTPRDVFSMESSDASLITSQKKKKSKKKKVSKNNSTNKDIKTDSDTFGKGIIISKKVAVPLKRQRTLSESSATSSVSLGEKKTVKKKSKAKTTPPKKVVTEKKVVKKKKAKEQEKPSIDVRGGDWQNFVASLRK